jgi:hypothetical protein
MGEDGVAAAVQGLSLEEGATFQEIVNAKKPYYSKRVELFEQYRARDVAAVEAAKAANVPITVVLPDGAKKSGIKGETTPLDVANDISKSLAKKVVVAKVDGEVWDLFRPLEGDCALSLHNFDDPEGKEVRYAAVGRSLSCTWSARTCNSSSAAVAAAVAVISHAACAGVVPVNLRAGDEHFVPLVGSPWSWSTVQELAGNLFINVAIGWHKHMQAYNCHACTEAALATMCSTPQLCQFIHGIS